jgi:hypothetical protein
MKKLIFILSLVAFTLSISAQGLYVPKAAGYNPAGADSSVVIAAVYDLQALPATSVIVGVSYTGAAAADSLARIEVYHALDRESLLAGRGRKVSTDATLRYSRVGAAAAEYKEESITVTGGIGFISIKLVPTGSPSSNFRIKPLLLVK